MAARASVVLSSTRACRSRSSALNSFAAAQLRLALIQHRQRGGPFRRQPFINQPAQSHHGRPGVGQDRTAKRRRRLGQQAQRFQFRRLDLAKIGGFLR